MSPARNETVLMDNKPAKPLQTQQAALDAALVALRPIAALLLDAGISAHELSIVARIACIEEATERHQRRNARPTVSSIAAATGLSRADVRQATLDSSSPESSHSLKPRAEDKLLAAWNSDPDFLDPHGTPRALKYSEGEPNFSLLVKRFAANIPPRAMLNAMLSSKAVAKQPDGTYLPTTANPRIDHPETAITYFGAKMSALGSTLLRNLSQSDSQRLFDTLISTSIEDEK